MREAPRAATDGAFAAESHEREGDHSAEIGDDAVEIVLRPDDLGRVKMTMAQDGDLLRVTVHADRAETLELMRRHSDQLGAELRQAGFSGASLSFGGQGRQPQSRGRSVAEIEGPEAAPTSHRLPLSGTGLDLRI